MKWQSNCAVCIKRENCNTKKELEKFYPVNIAIGCADCIVKQPTNADRIRAMSDEELAQWIDHIQADAYERGMMETPVVDYPNVYSNWLDWLKSPVEVDNGT